ncbi:MAG TPA: G1 family glutamic endopeptidase [Thermomicrobiaceae bacterium]|nr:G1 family glutamic endopeptidase [Thermomicrobiaceae bacterium]
MDVIRDRVRRHAGESTLAGRASMSRVLAVLVLSLALTACSVTRTVMVPTATVGADAVVTVQPSPTDPASAAATAVATAPVPAVTSTRTPVPTAGATVSTAVAASATPAGATPTTADAEAIKAVIQRGNQEETQALAANDPTVMRDTATASYYQQLAQDLSDLTDSGATTIALVKLTWGPIALTGPATARVTTVETWSTGFADGGTLVGTDTNLYTLLQENGVWKIQTDDQPGARPAQPSPGGTVSPTPVPDVTPVNPGQSSNWAGYAATGGTFTAVTGSWTVPSVSPSSTAAADATWVGIGGADTRDLIQAGTEATVAGGQVVYDAWLEMLPRSEQVLPLDVAAGDAVRVTITQQPDGRWQIVIEDTTTSYVYQISVTYASSRSSAEWIEEAPQVGRRSQAALDQFGTIHFTAATTIKDGKRQTIKQAGGESTSLYGRSAQPLAQPSVLGADGSSFSVTRIGAP